MPGSQSINQKSPTKGPILQTHKAKKKVVTLYVTDGGIFSHATAGTPNLRKLENTNRENTKKSTA